MIVRLGRFFSGSVALPVWLLTTVLWTLGMFGLFAALDSGTTDWRPDRHTLVAAVTVAVSTVVYRALDDIRDLAYDREYHPDRPLAAGLVRRADLLALAGSGFLVLLLLNAAVGFGLPVLLVQLAYIVVFFTVDQRYGWPDGDRVLMNLLVGWPVPVMLNVYLYTGFLTATGRTSWSAGVLAVVVATLASLTMEFTRKLTRSPRPGAHTYVEVFGVNGNLAVGLGCAVGATALVLAGTRPWSGGAAAWGWLVLLPAGVMASAAVRFWGRRAARWPAVASQVFLLSSYLVYLLIGLLAPGGAS
ncbi:hypothetical protein [Streptomyces sp. NPDC020298]|uniref:hypothetical protein n=1 Tax=unclassified Streptomyces TaxID=2593676 RepID=UPI0033D5D847